MSKCYSVKMCKFIDSDLRLLRRRQLASNLFAIDPVSAEKFFFSPCSHTKAQIWLQQGYFTSDTRFILRKGGGKEGEWTTLGGLIALNGRSMPFSVWCENEEERAELGTLSEEMVELDQRKKRLLRAISEAEARHTNVRTELNRVMQEMMPQILPPPGVDPFSLLSSCQGARRTLGSDVSDRLRKLTARFHKCDKKLIIQRTSALFPNVQSCTFCRVQIVSANSMLPHISTKKHINAMAGSVCADAFDFWWNTVDTVLKDPIASGSANVDVSCDDEAANEDEYQMERRPPSVMPDSTLPSAPIIKKISLPPGVDPFALLASCDGAKRKLEGDVERRLKALFSRFEKCDKKKLGQQIKGILSGEDYRICSLCGAKIISINNMLGHISHQKHIDAMGGAMCADAFDFWWNIVHSSLPDEPDLNFDGNRVSENAVSSLDRISPNYTPQSSSVLIRQQICPPPGVDPFALLKSCEGAKRKMTGDIDARFKDLLDLFEKCNKKKIVHLTNSLISVQNYRMCSFCDLKIVSSNVLLPHVCTKKHITAMNGSVCSDAFDFWWSAVNTVLMDDVAKLNNISNGDGETRTTNAAGCSYDNRTPITASSQGIKITANDKIQPVHNPMPSSASAASHKQIFPPSGVNPFALLNSCNRARRKMQGDLVGHFKQLRARFDQCDKKKLVQRTSEIFTKHRVTKCQLCQLKIDSSNNVVEHICGRMHIEAMEGSACADAFDFWWNALKVLERGMTVVNAKAQPIDENPKPASVAKSGPIEPPNLPGLAILRKTPLGNNPQPQRHHLIRMLHNYNACDRAKLNVDPLVLKLLQKPMLCMICNRGSIPRASDLVSHVVSAGHWDSIARENCGLPWNELKFWMDAISRATK
ncbi:hypothetical protein PMAYCL1PPCAC_08143 [Pristionchus mayeri]|uniref:C2H2-type domain-containing protein n=1 Tax=Pristionchus mayeri TaxID=1317129 RepID=A0AAN4ZG73_9BILA|nr:hypothetical protein PMAYCL1PPCAC_08143 [Pristionchus mayeri]